MKVILKSTFILTLFLSACKNNNGQDHEKYIQEYVAMQKPSYEFSPLIIHYNLVKKAIDRRQEEEGYKKIDKEYIDSIRDCNAALQEALANGYDSVKNINELDNGLDLKRKTLYATTEMSLAFKKYTAKYIKICGLGSNQARALYEKELSTREIQKTVESVLEDQVYTLNQFQQKYRITINEINEHGLIDNSK